jgi:hypothetical protein
LYLVLVVGTAALMFGMPTTALSELGQTFLLGASATRKSS